MDTMIDQIKDIVEPKDAILYEHIQKHVVNRWDKINVPLHSLSHVLTQNIILNLGCPNQHLGVGSREKPIQIQRNKLGTCKL